MSIQISRKELKRVVREEYKRIALKEDGSEMSRDAVEQMKDQSYSIAKKLAREIENVSMANQIDGQRLLASVIDQVKLQMKE